MILRLLSALLLLSCLSCASSDLRVQREEVYLNYTVQQDGENLASIARRFTGSAANWKALLHYNEGLDAYALKRGDVVRIPAHLMVGERPPRPQPIPLPPAPEAAPMPPELAPQTAVSPAPAGRPLPTAGGDQGARPTRPEEPTRPVLTQPGGAGRPADEEQRRKLRDELLDEILRE